MQTIYNCIQGYYGHEKNISSVIEFQSDWRSQISVSLKKDGKELNNAKPPFIVTDWSENDVLVFANDTTNDIYYRRVKNFGFDFGVSNIPIDERIRKIPIPKEKDFAIDGVITPIFGGHFIRRANGIDEIVTEDSVLTGGRGYETSFISDFKISLPNGLKPDEGVYAYVIVTGKPKSKDSPSPSGGFNSDYADIYLTKENLAASQLLVPGTYDYKTSGRNGLTIIYADITGVDLNDYLVINLKSGSLTDQAIGDIYLVYEQRYRSPLNP